VPAPKTLKYIFPRMLRSPYFATVVNDRGRNFFRHFIEVYADFMLWKDTLQRIIDLPERVFSIFLCSSRTLQKQRVDTLRYIVFILLLMLNTSGSWHLEWYDWFDGVSDVDGRRLKEYSNFLYSYAYSESSEPPSLTTAVPTANPTDAPTYVSVSFSLILEGLPQSYYDESLDQSMKNGIAELLAVDINLVDYLILNLQRRKLRVSSKHPSFKLKQILQDGRALKESISIVIQVNVSPIKNEHAQELSLLVTEMSDDADDSFRMMFEKVGLFPSSISVSSVYIKAEGGNDCLLLYQYDSSGDGWNGFYFTLLPYDGTTQSEPQSATLIDGSYDESCLGIESGLCYTFGVSQEGWWGHEITWSLCGVTGDVTTRIDFCVDDQSNCIPIEPETQFSEVDIATTSQITTKPSTMVYEYQSTQDSSFVRKSAFIILVCVVIALCSMQLCYCIRNTDLCMMLLPTFKGNGVSENMHSSQKQPQSLFVSQLKDDSSQKTCSKPRTTNTQENSFEEERESFEIEINRLKESLNQEKHRREEQLLQQRKLFTLKLAHQKGPKDAVPANIDKVVPASDTQKSEDEEAIGQNNDLDEITMEMSSSPDVSVGLKKVEIPKCTAASASAPAPSSRTLSSVLQKQKEQSANELTAMNEIKQNESAVDIAAKYERERLSRNTAIPQEEWACSACTFMNKPSRTNCDMCGSINKKETEMHQNYLRMIDDKDSDIYNEMKDIL